MKFLKKHRSLRTAAVAAILICSLLLTTGCDNPVWNAVESKLPFLSGQTEPPAPVDTGISLNAFRQAMVDTPQFFAVAYFGYHETLDSDLPVDPIEAMREEAPRLCEDLPFLLDIPQDRIIGETGDLFCIVPLDTDATVTVSKGIWDEANYQYVYDNILYSSNSGEPILLLCNDSGWEPDVQVTVSGPSGEACWYPYADDNRCAVPLRDDNWDNVFYDFSPYREMLIGDYRDMKGEWSHPTAEMLADTAWSWSGWLKDGREVSYSVKFHQDTLDVEWTDGVEETSYIYTDAPWELTYEDDYAVLRIDFDRMAGVLEYNLLYHEDYETLYVALNVLQEEMPVGWEPLYRFLYPQRVPEPAEMVGTWELAWTELEGEVITAEPGDCFIEITTDYNGLYWFSYMANNFPPYESFYNQELVVFPEALYYGCGNDRWLAAVNYTDRNGTEYAVSLLPDDTLLLQRYWVTDGFQMVSYSCYYRVS